MKGWGPWCLLAWLVAGCGGPPGVQEGLYVVKLTEPAHRRTLERREPPDLLDGLKAHGLESEVSAVTPAFGEAGAVNEFDYDRYYHLSAKRGAPGEAILDALEASGAIEYVEPAYLLTDPGLTTPDDPKLPRQWYLEKLGIPDAWRVTRGKGVRVADVESGFDVTHPDLEGRIDLRRSRDYDPDTDDSTKVNDNKMSHGTSVLGVLGARAGNGKFGAGVAFESVLIASQMANSAETSADEKAWTVITADAILGSVERGAGVVLVEKQIPTLASSVEASRVIHDAITASVKNGVVVVVPAGNFDDELTAEARLPDSGSIVVGAVTKEGKPASFTNHGERVTLSAYGEGLYTIAENKGETERFGGTSGAAALVAGIAALVRSARPELGPRAVRQVMAETGLPIEGRRSIGTLVQAGDAVRRALELE